MGRLELVHLSDYIRRKGSKQSVAKSEDQSLAPIIGREIVQIGEPAKLDILRVPGSAVVYDVDKDLGQLVRTAVVLAKSLLQPVADTIEDSVRRRFTSTNSPVEVAIHPIERFRVQFLGEYKSFPFVPEGEDLPIPGMYAFYTPQHEGVYYVHPMTDRKQLTSPTEEISPNVNNIQLDNPDARALAGYSLTVFVKRRQEAIRELDKAA